MLTKMSTVIQKANKTQRMAFISGGPTEISKTASKRSVKQADLITQKRRQTIYILTDRINFFSLYTNTID